VSEQAEYFTRVPEERRRHLSMAGGLPLEVLLEETQASRRFRKVRGLSGLGAIARAVAVDRLDVGFVDILPCEGCLDHPLLGPRDELFRRRQIVGATEPARSRAPVVEEAVARGVKVAEAFPISKNGHRPQTEAVEAVLKEIGLAPNGKPWDCGAARRGNAPRTSAPPTWRRATGATSSCWCWCARGWMGPWASPTRCGLPSRAWAGPSATPRGW